MQRGTEKESLKNLILKLEKLGKKNKVGLWVTASKLLALPRRRCVAVNVSKVEKSVSEKEIALVPGKLLGDGVIERKLTIAAYVWTPGAKKRIESAGGSLLSIDELVDRNPKGTDVRIIR